MGTPPPTQREEAWILLAESSHLLTQDPTLSHGLYRLIMMLGNTLRISTFGIMERILRNHGTTLSIMVLVGMYGTKEAEQWYYTWTRGTLYSFTVWIVLLDYTTSPSVCLSLPLILSSSVET